MPVTAQFDSGQRTRSRSLRLVDRLRFQLGGAILAGIVLPYLVALLVFPGGADFGLIQRTLSGSFVAIMAGLWLVRNIDRYPGVESTTYILPSLIISFGLLVIVFLFLRMDYNRTALGISFAASALWLALVDRWRNRGLSLVIGVVPGGNIGHLPPQSHIRWLDLDAQSRTDTLDALVVDLHAELSDVWSRKLADYALSGTPIYDVKRFRESLSGQVELEHLSENSSGLLTPLRAYMRVKHLLDWLAALVVLVCVFPLLVIVAILIKIDTPGPALFRQKRTGQGGHVFRVYKFRTMRVDGGGSKSDALAAAMTQENDVRITRFGRFLRRSRIDELPQLINVICGEMSWIGPRPEAEVLSQWYEEQVPFYRYRHIVRPGITGWAQVNQGHVTEVEAIRTKLHYDFYYIKHFSVWLDLVIVARTLATIFSGFGSR